MWRLAYQRARAGVKERGTATALAAEEQKTPAALRLSILQQTSPFSA
jgi:hypothetical protein